MGWRKIVGALVAVGVASAAAPACAKQAWTGRYRVVEGPDVVGGLELGADHRFRYVLAAGALDEEAQGRWVEDGDVVRLTTEPKPRPATFAAAPPAADANEGPLRVSVVFPNREGIPGVEFKIGFASGEPIENYVQYDGWKGGLDETRQPQWIELYEPIHAVRSQRFAVPPGQRALAFVLTPNDIAIVDFESAVLEHTPDRVILHHPRGQLRFTPGSN